MAGGGTPDVEKLLINTPEVGNCRLRKRLRFPSQLRASVVLEMSSALNATLQREGQMSAACKRIKRW